MFVAMNQVEAHKVMAVAESREAAVQVVKTALRDQGVDATEVNIVSGWLQEGIAIEIVPGENWEVVSGY